MNEIIDLLKREQNVQWFTVPEFAEKLDLAPAQLRMIYKGDRGAGNKTIGRLIKYFDGENDIEAMGILLRYVLSQIGLTEERLNDILGVPSTK